LLPTNRAIGAFLSNRPVKDVCADSRIGRDLINLIVEQLRDGHPVRNGDVAMCGAQEQPDGIGGNGTALRDRLEGRRGRPKDRLEWLVTCGDMAGRADRRRRLPSCTSSVAASCARAESTTTPGAENQAKANADANRSVMNRTSAMIAPACMVRGFGRGIH
jgi:hypothetical protein